MNLSMARPPSVALVCRWSQAVQAAWHCLRGGWLAMSQSANPAKSEQTNVAAVFTDIEQADLEAAKSGDQDAYRRLIERHQQEIGRFLWKFTRDHTAWEELLQTVFVEAYLSLHKFRAEAALVDWLRGIATHVGCRFWTDRKKRRERTTSLNDSLELSEGTSIWPTLGLFEMLEQLPPRDRLVLTLMYVEERSVEETARLAGWTESMVKSQAHRARIKLKTLWEEAHGQ